MIDIDKDYITQITSGHIQARDYASEAGAEVLPHHPIYTISGSVTGDIHPTSDDTEVDPISEEHVFNPESEIAELVWLALFHREAHQEFHRDGEFSEIQIFHDAFLPHDYEADHKIPWSDAWCVLMDDLEAKAEALRKQQERQNLKEITLKQRGNRLNNTL